MKVYLGEGKSTRSEVRYNCPFCHRVGKNNDSKFHLYIRRKEYGKDAGFGVFHCFRCGAKGWIDQYSNFHFSDSDNIYETDLDSLVLKRRNDMEETDISPNGVTPKSEKKAEDFEKLYKVGGVIGKMGVDYWEERGFDREEAELFDIRLDQESYRIIIPIKDLEGVNKFYIGRGISEFVKPKYWLSPGAEKSNYIYNIHMAKDFEEIFLFEGTLDAMSGGRDCVAILGKELGEGQLNQLRKTSIKKIYVGLDPDVDLRDILKVVIKMKLKLTIQRIEFPSREDLNDMRMRVGKEGVRIFLENMKKKT